MSEDAEEPAPSESEILAKLVSNLGQCPGQSMPLAEILNRLPPNLRRLAGDPEGVSRWLQGFPGLLELSGPPGEVRVSLTVGKLQLGRTESKVATPGEDSSKAPQAGPAPPGPVLAGYAASTGSSAVIPAHASPDGNQAVKATPAAKSDANGFVGDEDSYNPCSVQLRGLPFRATVADVRAFLAHHANNLSPVKDNIRLLLNRDGRPSGFARVFFTSPQAAQNCRDSLHKKQMKERYIEVLANTERSVKARNRRVAEADAGIADNAIPASADAASEQAERERILQECRDHMSIPGHQTLLLSMLGIALSEPARQYLRRVNMGLKHFLARFPHEFHVEGPKGCEKVLWLNAGIAPDMASIFGGCGMPGEAAALAPKEPSTPEKNWLLLSPGQKQPQSTHSHYGMETPSDWGTPGPAQAGASLAQLGAGMDFSSFAAGSAWPNYNWPTPWSQPWTMPWPQTDANGGIVDPTAAKATNKSAKKAGDGTTSAVSGRSHAHLHPQSHPFAGRTGANAQAEENEKRKKEAVDAHEVELQNSGVAALRLRGLPFSVTVQDVLAFFAQHDVADRIADGPQAAQLLPKANGRPSGQAVVQMRSRREAEEAQVALTGKYVGSRYIEIFVYGDADDGEGATNGGEGGSQPPAFTGPTPSSTSVAHDPLASPEPLPDWAAGFAQAAPWALPWGSLPPPLTGGGAGPQPPVVGAGLPLVGAERMEPTWENIMSISAGSMTAPTVAPPLAIDVGSADNLDRKENSI
eukprot:TRINITY_DN11360_c0_g1_i1.p1 TRINITY_DN11360_c0_g1~~TRINITY_DN11360_c0_g1_i1.p1  ORF type:complete len:781 (-),score=117.75 TRINITY_DN11360_c0_g1_i1:222-2477(-)